MFVPRAAALRFDKLAQLAALFARLGVTNAQRTGAEPVGAPQSDITEVALAASGFAGRRSGGRVAGHRPETPDRAWILSIRRCSPPWPTNHFRWARCWPVSRLHARLLLGRSNSTPHSKGGVSDDMRAREDRYSEFGGARSSYQVRAEMSCLGGGAEVTGERFSWWIDDAERRNKRRGSRC